MSTTKSDLSLLTLRAGDVILYRPPSIRSGLLPWLIGQAIAFKTWTNVSHCEVYIGGGMSLASRDGQGVAKYPLRTTGAGFVLRAHSRLKFPNALDWFYRRANHKGYDWLGLLTFTRLRRRGDSDKMFCSEFVCQLFRDGFNIPLFDQTWCCDRVPPSMLLSSNALYVVWTDGKPI